MYSVKKAKKIAQNVKIFFAFFIFLYIKKLLRDKECDKNIHI